jgi:hypothetical protein
MNFFENRKNLRRTPPMHCLPGWLCTDRDLAVVTFFLSFISIAPFEYLLRLRRGEIYAV